MKNLIIVAIVAVSLIGAPIVSYSGDEEWATAGKVLAIVEGVRIITGGNVDPIGNITGIKGNNGWFSGGNSSYSRR